jgi:hypothetical protein
VVSPPKYVTVMTVATAAAKAMTAVAVLKATSDESQPHRPVARAVAAERMKKMNMR